MTTTDKPVIIDKIIKEDDRYIYGETWEDNTKITDYLIYKLGGKPPVIPINTPLSKEDFIKQVIESRLIYVKNLGPKKAKEFIDRLIKEGYDLYGQNYEEYYDN